MPILYVVATPIGNLSDASARMIETLEKVDLVIAEDTRVSGNLLRHFGISKRMTSLHRHNEADKASSVVERMLAEDISAALVTDAGTPAISDPGYFLVREAAAAGIEVLAIAGPTALAAAISVSGFDAREFAFYGFLPREKGPLRKKLLEISAQADVAVLHESPHRIIGLMEEVARTLPGCLACVCCDLTKLYEKTLRGPAGDVLAALQANPKTDKGEYCVVLDFHEVRLPEDAPEATGSVESRYFALIYEGMDSQDAVDTLVREGVRKNEAKRAALAVRGFMTDWQA